MLFSLSSTLYQMNNSSSPSSSPNNGGSTSTLHIHLPPDETNDSDSCSSFSSSSSDEKSSNSESDTKKYTKITPVKRKKQFEHPKSKKRKLNDNNNFFTTKKSKFTISKINNKKYIKTKSTSVNEILNLKNYLEDVLVELEAKLNTISDIKYIDNNRSTYYQFDVIGYKCNNKILLCKIYIFL